VERDREKVASSSPLHPSPPRGRGKSNFLLEALMKREIRKEYPRNRVKGD
jgi:hypothetical protein